MAALSSAANMYIVQAPTGMCANRMCICLPDQRYVYGRTQGVYVRKDNYAHSVLALKES